MWTNVIPFMFTLSSLILHSQPSSLSALKHRTLCSQCVFRPDSMRFTERLSFELLQCMHGRCHHARISYAFIQFNTSNTQPAKTRTFKSTLLVAMTHLIFPPPPLSSFFTTPLTSPLESPFDVGPTGTSGAHLMLLTKCP
jgi:hypothetical protein